MSLEVDTFGLGTGSPQSLTTTSTPQFLSLGVGAAASATIGTITFVNGTVTSAASVGLSQASAGIKLTGSGYFGLALQPSSGNAGEPFFELDGVGTGNFPYAVSYFARGTAGSQTAVQSADILYQQDVVGEIGNLTVQASASVIVTATETFATGGHRGVSYAIATSANAVSGSPLNRIFIDGSGNTNIQNGSLVPQGGIAAGGGFTVSPRLVHTGGIPALSAASSYTAQTPVVTEFYFAEAFVPANMTVTGVAVFNGGTVSGNMKVGLFNSAGTLVATSASTAMVGTTAYQLVPFTGTYAAKGPATYFVGVFYDNITARPNTYTAGSFGVGKSTGQTYATGFTAITPPTTFTTALGPVASLY